MPEQRVGRAVPGISSAAAKMTLTNAWAMGTTYCVFVAVARHCTVRDTGHFALAQTFAAAAVLITDGGLGQLVVREARQSGNLEGFVSWGFRRRVRLVLGISPLILAGCLLAGFGPVAAFLTCVLVSGNAWYGFSCVIRQAKGDLQGLAHLQLVNGALYAASTLAALAFFDHWTLVTGIAIPCLAVTLIALVDMPRQRKLIAAAPTSVAHIVDRRHFGPLLAANAITSNVDSLGLGFMSSATLASYAASQKPTQGISAVSLAVANVALPTMAKMDPATLGNVNRRALQSALFAPLASAGAYACSGLLSQLYGKNLVDPLTLALLVPAAYIGVLCVVPSNSLIATSGTRDVTNAAIGQAIIVTAGVAAGAALSSGTLVAASVLVGRIGVLSYTYLRAQRHLLYRSSGSVIG